MRSRTGRAGSWPGTAWTCPGSRVGRCTRALVGDLLALTAQREHAYAQDDPTPVMEWATRWLPAGITRIHSRLHHCAQDHAHHHAGHLLDATGLTSENGLTDTATWWTTARAVPGPDWLHLPPLD